MTLDDSLYCLKEGKHTIAIYVHERHLRTGSDFDRLMTFAEHVWGPGKLEVYHLGQRVYVHPPAVDVKLLTSPQLLPAASD